MSDDPKVPEQFLKALEELQFTIQKAVFDFARTVDGVEEVKAPTEVVAITEASRAIGIAIFSMIQNITDEHKAKALEELLKIVAEESSRTASMMTLLKVTGILDAAKQEQSDTTDAIIMDGPKTLQ